MCQDQITPSKQVTQVHPAQWVLVPWVQITFPPSGAKDCIDKRLTTAQRAPSRKELGGTLNLTQNNTAIFGKQLCLAQHNWLTKSIRCLFQRSLSKITCFYSMCIQYILKRFIYYGNLNLKEGRISMNSARYVIALSNMYQVNLIPYWLIRPIQFRLNKIQHFAKLNYYKKQ